MKTNYILSIGDIHGREEWKVALFGSVSSYDQWEQESKNHGIGAFMADVYPIGFFDKVVFVGDYVDSFDKSNVEIKRNLEQIIYVKTIFPDKVVLLLGNHDLSYIYGERFYCSGNRPEARFDLNLLFKTSIEGKSAFQAAYQDGLHLWTHAGVTRGFQVDCLEGFKRLLPNTLYSEIMPTDLENMNYADILNLMHTVMHPDLFRVSFSRGGHSTIPGIFWADKKELYDKPAYGISQIVGHSRVKQIKGYQFNAEVRGRVDEIYFIDNLEDDGCEFLITDLSNPGARNIPLYGDCFESLTRLKSKLGIITDTSPVSSNEETFNLVGNIIKDKLKG